MWLKPRGLKIPEKSLHIRLLQNMRRNTSIQQTQVPGLCPLYQHPRPTHTRPHALTPGKVLNVSPTPSWARPSVDSALLCLCSAVSLLPFKQISLLHCTGLLYF